MPQVTEKYHIILQKTSRFLPIPHISFIYIHLKSAVYGISIETPSCLHTDSRFSGSFLRFLPIPSLLQSGENPEGKYGKAPENKESPWSFHGDSGETPIACRNRSVAERPSDTVQQASLQGNVVAVEGNDCACREKRTDASKGFRVLVAGNVKDGQDKEVANL